MLTVRVFRFDFDNAFVSHVSVCINTKREVENVSAGMGWDSALLSLHRLH